MTRAASVCLLLLVPGFWASAQDRKDDPKSTNKSVILGKWKVTEPPATTKQEKEEFEQLSKLGIWMYLEFKGENAFVLGLSSDNKELLETLKKSAPGGKITFEAKYQLLAGEKVEVYDVKDDALKSFVKDGKATSDIVIKKDEMTVKDPDGKTTKLVRMKETKDKPEKK